MMLPRHARTATIALLAVALALALALPAGAARDSLEQAREQRAALQTRVANTLHTLETVRARYAHAQEVRRSLESDVAVLQQRASVAQEALAARALRIFKQQDRGALHMAMTADDPFEFLERARLLEGATRQQQDSIERATAAQVALDTRRAELDEIVTQLEADQTHLVELHRELDAAFREAQLHEKELATRRARQRRVARGRQQGVYACPIKPPFSFRDTWGAPRSGGRRHKGVDIFGPMGQEVYAITNGAIARRSSSRLGGIGLYLDGDDGNLYYYAHLKAIRPGYGAGVRVEAGELIAFNGASGNASTSSPHIHMQVHPGGGGAVNPYPFASAACY